jgi:hypothetical protein
MVGHEETPLLAAKNCTAENWRNISCSKRNHGTSVLRLFAVEGIYLSSSLELQVHRYQIFCEKTVNFHNPCGHFFYGWF